MEKETEKKRGRGRPAKRKVLGEHIPVKVFSLKADVDLIGFLDGMVGKGRNRFINEAIREKAIREGFLTECKGDEKDG